MVVMPSSGFREPWLEPLATRLQKLKPNTIRVGYFYEVPDSGSFRYRAYNMAQALNTYSKTHSASYFYLSDLPLIERFTDHLDVIVLVRFRHSGVLGRLIDQFRAANKPVLFDIDDLLFSVDHASIVAATLNFGIEPGLVLDNWYALTTRLGHTLSLCDAAIATTPTLAQEISKHRGIPATVIPNFLNLEQLEASEIIRTKKQLSSQKPFRIGYFSGSKSHAKDFEVATTGIVSFLKSHPDATLVVAGILEIPNQLAPVSDQIDRLPFMDYLKLQDAVSQVDVNIVPLQENVFTDSKSELKFFEAAIVETPTIASPTEVFARVIKDGTNGFLSPAVAWLDTLERVHGLSDNHLQSLKEAARKAAQKTYTSKNMVTTIESVVMKSL